MPVGFEVNKIFMDIKICKVSSNLNLGHNCKIQVYFSLIINEYVGAFQKRTVVPI
jgi:hypothetical protein